MFKMKIYLDSLHIKDYISIVTNKGDDIFGPKKVYYKTWLLTPEGKYKIIDNNYYKFKLQQNDAIVIDNYLPHSRAICEKSYFKKFGQIYTIPISHQKIKIKKNIYKKDPSISLIVEKTNDTFTDIYFLTNNDIQDPDIKQTIISFLSILT